MEELILKSVGLLALVVIAVLVLRFNSRRAKVPQSNVLERRRERLQKIREQQAQETPTPYDGQDQGGQP